MGDKMLPMFKWSGGKRRELQHVQKLAPTQFTNYCEPFVGGGAVWFSLAHKKNHIGDTNADVINFYNVVKQHGKVFIDDLNSMSTFYTDTMADLKVFMDATAEHGSWEPTRDPLLWVPMEHPQEMCAKKWRKQKRDEYRPLAEFYYNWRDGEHATDYDIAKRFYVLRNLAFGGMLRYNSEGKFNVPYGYYKNFKKLAWNSDYEGLFSNSKFECQPWKSTVSKMTTNDFVFLDPPYTREFTKYSADGDFGEQDHRELAKWFSSKSTKAMIILNKDDFTESLYSNFIKNEYEFSYGVRYRKDRLNKDDVTTYHFVATNY